MSEQETALRVTVHGRVQGVFYRDWTVQTARELGLTGWVKNKPDGTVAALLQGTPGNVRTMVDRMGDGPPAARVSRIEQQACAREKTAEFARR